VGSSPCNRSAAITCCRSLYPRGRQCCLEGFHIIRHGRNAGLHDDDGIIVSLGREAENAPTTGTNAGLSRPRGAPALLRVAPVDPLEQIAHLAPAQMHHATLRGGPDEAPALQPFGIKR